MSGTRQSAPMWRAVAGAAPFRAWRNEDLHRLADVLGAALAAWALDWELSVYASAPVRCLAAAGHAERNGSWQSFARGDAGVAWKLERPAGFLQLAATWLSSGEGGSAAVARSLAASCELDAQRRLASALQLEPASGRAAPDTAVWSPWSGAVVAELSGSCTLLLEAEVVRRLVRPAAVALIRHPLVPLAEAMSHRTLRLQVELAGCELPLGELAGLRVGDVLRLRHAVDAPARVRNAAAGVLFDGWLARSRGRRALELASQSASRREEQR